jgi:hypothetical protein
VPDPGPAAQEYAARLAARTASAEGWRRRAGRLANVRLALFGIGLAIAVAAAQGTLEWLWLAAPGVGFVAAVFAHRGVREEEVRARRAMAFYERGLARLAHRFGGQGRTGERYADPAHPYAVHLDLFGPSSLFELLSGAQTRGGEDTLARWLLEPAAPDEIRARHAAVRELAPDLDLREDLATHGPEAREGIDPDALAAWGEYPGGLLRSGRRIGALACNAVAATTLACWLWLGAGPLPFLAALAIQAAFARWLAHDVRRATEGIARAAHDLELLGALLARVERERFTCEKLVALRRALDTDGASPSRRVAELRRRLDLLDSRKNQMFAPIAPLLLWTTHCAFAIEGWRRRCGPRLRVWLATLGEIEALGDLATYHYEHPDDPFPELSTGEARFDASGLGHPLIARDRCVRNDVALGPKLNLLLVSGSNMSGKSTLLRSVGVAAVMAQAGAPVCAGRLSLSPLSVGASLRAQDSLVEGASRFYAEITALRRVSELAGGPRALLFLLDELLQGTNSHDRRIGAAGLLRSLVSRGAIGLVTTHDLALAEVAEALGPRAANVHFADELVDGALHFDYRLRPGVVTRSNALELMRAVGLDVAEGD